MTAMADLRSHSLPDELPACHPDLEVAGFEGELVVFDTRTNQVHMIRDTFAVVFDACDGTTASSALVDELVDGGISSTG